MENGIFTIEGLAGFRIDVVGFHWEDGHSLVTSIVADSPAEASDELAELLVSEDYAGWEELYSIPHAAWLENWALGDAAKGTTAVRLR